MSNIKGQPKYKTDVTTEQMLLWHYRDGMTRKEIAEKVGISPKGVTSRFRNAKNPMKYKALATKAYPMTGEDGKIDKPRMQEIVRDSVTRPVTDRKYQNRTEPYSFEELIGLAERGMTDSEIAQISKLQEDTVKAMFRRYGYSREGLMAFKNQRANVLALLQCRILQSISSDDLAKASLSQRLVALGIAYDKERIERNLSTSNISVFETVIEKSHKRPKRYT